MGPFNSINGDCGISTCQYGNPSNMIHQVGLEMPWTTEGLGLFWSYNDQSEFPHVAHNRHVLKKRLWRPCLWIPIPCFLIVGAHPTWYQRSLGSLGWNITWIPKENVVEFPQNLAEITEQNQLQGWFKWFSWSFAEASGSSHAHMASCVTMVWETEGFLSRSQIGGWEEIDIKVQVQQALDNTERFGPCLLYCLALMRKTGRHRTILMQLKERRIQRQVQRGISILWDRIRVVEWTVQGAVLSLELESFQPSFAMCEGNRKEQRAIVRWPAIRTFNANATKGLVICWSISSSIGKSRILDF